MIDVSLLASLLHSDDQDNHFYGVTVGVVTNNQDPEGLGRVKVRFPWLWDEQKNIGVDSHWARVLTPMAGNNRGLYFLPEVEDEVLVAFEHGLAEFPYILGGLWNGKDKQPENNNDGQNNKRTIKSRSGHIIRLDDSKGQEKIEIIDGSGKNTIVINTANNSITITANADITIESLNGKLTLSGSGIEINSTKGVDIKARQDMSLKAGPELKINGGLVRIN
ncbi:phage baseplate assembly protein V [Nostoc sp. ChiVER01]|uniref:phage baseplate assembly protein V n=1 Tax=Nostoc sp. ChiVER01 TaxID=3075382 RepID=UPI002AD34A0E|nr:phage baseplate assembly protein V [Nostoc sp. ChiVER01]MDZ8228187.1 phage baseplate assembly protein V [Nostoc sp. ChiVER01]